MAAAKALFGKFSKSKKSSTKSVLEDKFEIIGKNMVIYKDSLKIKMKTNQWHTAYGLLNISSLSEQHIFKWTIKITRRLTAPKMCIGICSKRDDENSAFHQKYDRFFYGYCTKDGTKLSSFDRNNEYHSPPAKHHDVIIMELNIHTKTLKYYKNGEDLGIAFTDIDLRQSYYLSIAIFGSDSKVEIMGFEKYKQNFNVENDEKDNNIVKEYVIKDDNKQNEILNISLEEMNDKLQKDNNELCDKIDELNEILLKRKQEKRKQQDEINNLKTIVSKIREDSKEMENEHLELQNKINMLKLQKLDEINYSQWNTKQLVYWIVHINYNEYKKYEEILTNVLSEEQIDGSCLKDIELEDMQTWNIDVVQHRNHILNNLKLLTHKPIENHMYIDMNTQQEAYIPPLPPPAQAELDSMDNNLNVDKISRAEFDDVIQNSIPYESKQSEIIPYNTQIVNENSSLDDIDNIAPADVNVDKLQSEIEYQKYDSLDVMQQKYLMEEMNEKDNNSMITPQ